MIKKWCAHAVGDGISTLLHAFDVVEYGDKRKAAYFLCSGWYMNPRHIVIADPKSKEFTVCKSCVKKLGELVKERILKSNGNTKVVP